MVKNHKSEVFFITANGHLYVVGRDFEEKSCQTRRKVGARSDLSDRQNPRLPYYNMLCADFLFYS